MSGEIREFLTAERPTISGMSQDDLAAEVEGWRIVMALLPLDIYEWLARMHEVVRFTKRNYTGHVGVLLGVRFEPVEYTIGVRETAFSGLTGKRMVEDKTMTLPAASIMFFEAINDVQDFDPQVEDDALAAQSLEYSEVG